MKTDVKYTGAGDQSDIILINHAHLSTLERIYDVLKVRPLGEPIDNYLAFFPKNSLPDVSTSISLTLLLLTRICLVVMSTPKVGK